MAGISGLANGGSDPCLLLKQPLIAGDENCLGCTALDRTQRRVDLRGIAGVEHLQLHSHLAGCLLRFCGLLLGACIVGVPQKSNAPDVRENLMQQIQAFGDELGRGS